MSKNKTLKEARRELRKARERSWEILKRDRLRRKLEHALWKIKWEKHLQEWEKTCQKLNLLAKIHGR